MSDRMEHGRCGHCDSKNDGQREFFDKHAEIWDKITIHEQDKVDYIASLLRLKGDERILDVGTGTGVMIPFYEKYLTGGSVLAVDFSEKMIAQCVMKFPHEKHPSVVFEAADVYDLDFDNEFDIIMCYSCFPHFKDHQRALDIFAKALKVSGRLAIAHSSSREHINHVHAQGGHEIEGDVLPLLVEFSAMFGKAGLFVTFEQSDEEYHIIIGEKE
ncbi:MAG: methyltransferase domain-containing protein [Candidatus Methanoplasma sp.]|jgi:demethylmenaquinone methyltransferase/2-methoxy-6-polyprenyl-1,4-benzoquinol methylase|nr:methyltransferase domain-containing protein [Candidatus Methanoplasma sp.]